MGRIPLVEGLAGFAGLAGIWEEFRWKRGDLAGFAGLVVVGRILLVAGPRRLCRLGWGYGDYAAGKGMSSPALPAARALSLAAGPLQDK